MKKVLLLCPYSAPSACGVWSRVYSDAIALKNEGYDVHIFSSNIIKGTKDISSDFEEIDGLKIYRFKVMFSAGGSAMFWNFLSKISEVNPDIIHTHGYRHPHSFFSMIWGKINNKVVYLTTHAPFEKDPRRSVVMKLIDFLYDGLIGWWELKSYWKVIRISNWELPFLEKLGLKDSFLIPNGLKDMFLKTKPIIDGKVLKRAGYFGRIDPVKRLEWIIEAAKNLKDIQFKITGPLSGYPEFQSDLDNLQIDLKTYTSEELIEGLKGLDIYILPSAREAMPFTLLEAMSQGKIVISSPNYGSKEVIEEGKNGFIVNNSSELIEKIKYIYNNWDEMQSIRYNSIEKSKEYNSVESNKKLIDLYKS